MNENQMSGWQGMDLTQGFALPPSQADTPANTYGGGVVPSPLNGYPMFSSSQAGTSTPSGYASANPVDSQTSVVPPQARNLSGLPPAPQTPSTQPQQANYNPWNIKQSSGMADPFSYPSGIQTPEPKINVF